MARRKPKHKPGEPLSKTLIAQNVYFQTTFYDESELNQMPELRELGYSIIDVKGDGNCGYYSMLLGLVDVSLLPLGKVNKASYLQNMVGLRRKLADFFMQRGKKVLLANAYQDVTLFEPHEDEMERILQSMHSTGCDEEFYTSELPSDCQMQLPFGPLMLAVAYRITIVAFS